MVAERLSLLKQQQIKLEAQRATTATDTAIDDQTRAMQLAELAVQRARIDEQVQHVEDQISQAAADAAAATRAAALEAADAAAASRTAASEAADAAAMSATAAPLGSHIHVVA